MIAASAIGQDQLLLGYVNYIYIVGVDDQASAKAQEVGTFVAKLVSDHVFQLTELVRHKPLAVVKSDHIGIVAFR